MTLAIDETTKLAALERRVQELEDKEKIRETLARYGYTADLGLSKDWVGVWTEKGVYDLGPDHKAVGSDGLLYDIITNPKGHKTIENRSLHTVVNHFIRVNGDTAWAEAYSIVFIREGDGYIPWTCGYNHFEFERRGDRWAITLRHRRAVGGDEWGGKVIKAFAEE